MNKKIKIKIFIIVIALVLMSFSLYELYYKPIKYDGFVSDNNSSEQKVCTLVDTIVKDINDNKGTPSKSYKQNVQNKKIYQKIYRYSDFDEENINYNEIKGVILRDTMNKVILKNQKSSFFLHHVEYEPSLCVYYQSKNDFSFFNEIKRKSYAKVCLSYTDGLILKKDCFNDAYEGQIIKKGEEIQLDSNQLYFKLEMKEGNWVITNVERRYKVKFNSIYDFVDNGKQKLF